MNALLSGVFVIDGELYEDLTEDDGLGPTERGDQVIILRFSVPDGSGLNNYLLLRRGMTVAEVADGLRCTADGIEEWQDEN